MRSPNTRDACAVTPFLKNIDYKKNYKCKEHIFVIPQNAIKGERFYTLPPPPKKSCYKNYNKLKTHKQKRWEIKRKNEGTN